MKTKKNVEKATFPCFFKKFIKRLKKTRRKISIN